MDYKGYTVVVCDYPEKVLLFLAGSHLYQVLTSSVVVLFLFVFNKKGKKSLANKVIFFAVISKQAWLYLVAF